MKIVLLILVLFATSLCCLSQYNLVPNYSFEDSVICPTQFNGGPMPRPWYLPTNGNTNFYFNSCSIDLFASVPYNIIGDTSFQYPKTGNGYAAFDAFIPLNSRIYIQIRLKDSLLHGKCYHCTFWVSLCNPCGIATNNIAMWFTKTAIYSDTIADPSGLALIPGNPQVYNYGNPVIKDTQNWIKVSSVYVAQGGEQFITIGNFKNDANTVFENIGPNPAMQTLYYVDDVSVIPLDSLPLKADAGQDATIALGDSVFIGSLTNGITNITWYNSSGTVINTTAPGFYVSPTVSTFYVVEQTVCGYYSRDTVYVNVWAMPLYLLSFTANTTNNKTVGLYWQTANEFNVSHFNVQRSYSGTNAFENIGSVTANNKPYNTYSFEDLPTRNEKQETVLYRLQSVDKDGTINYSKIVKVIMKDKERIEVYPNPATDFVTIKGKDIQRIEIINAYGAVVYSNNYALNRVNTIYLNNISSGLYYLKITDNDNVVITKKLFKNLD